jgi:probable phosphoglycerate mutase
MPGLREIHHGLWEGQRPRDVQEQSAADYAAWEGDPFLAAPPDGETGLAVLARALPAFRQIVADHPGQTVFVVSHKATNRLLLCSLLGIDGRFYRDRITQELACLNVLIFKTPSDARVALMNDISHYANLPS